MECFASPDGGVGIYGLVGFCERVEQAPGSSWQECTVTWFSPFTKNVRNLSGGDDSCIKASDHNVMGTGIIDLHLLVPGYPVIQFEEFVSQLTNSTGGELVQVTFCPPCVFATDADLPAESKVVTHKDP